MKPLDQASEVPVAIAIQAALKVQAARAEADAFRGQLAKIINGAARLMEDIQEVETIRYTGWVALLRVDSSGNWTCLGCFKPDIHDDIPEEGWSVVLPIPEPETVKDFEGF